MKPLGTHSVGKDHIGPLAGSDANKLVAVGTQGGLRLLEATSGKEAKAIRLRRSAVRATFAPDGRSLAVAVEDEPNVRLYDAGTGKQAGRLPFPDRPGAGAYDAGALAFHPTRPVLAIGMGRRSYIPIWDVAREEELREIDFRVPFDPEKRDDDRPPSGLGSACFSRDGRTLLAACWYGKLRMWELASGRLRHAADIEALHLAMAPDGGLLATAGRDSRIRLWDWRDTEAKQPELSARGLEQLWGTCPHRTAWPRSARSTRWRWPQRRRWRSSAGASGASSRSRPNG